MAFYEQRLVHLPQSPDNEAMGVSILEQCTADDTYCANTIPLRL